MDSRSLGLKRILQKIPAAACGSRAGPGGVVLTCCPSAAGVTRSLLLTPASKEKQSVLGLHPQEQPKNSSDSDVIPENLWQLVKSGPDGNVRQTAAQVVWAAHVSGRG